MKRFIAGFALACLVILPFSCKKTSAPTPPAVPVNPPANTATATLTPSPTITSTGSVQVTPGLSMTFTITPSSTATSTLTVPVPPTATSTLPPCPDTLGKTSAVISGTVGARFGAQPITVASTCTLQSLVMPLMEVDPDCQIRLGVYQDDGAGNPVSLIYGSNVQTAVEGDNIVGPINVVLAPGNYWLAYNIVGGAGGGATTTDDGNVRIQLDVSAGDVEKFSAVQLPMMPFPDPFPTSNVIGSTLAIVVYAYYCPGGVLPTDTATATPSPTPTSTLFFTFTPTSIGTATSCYLSAAQSLYPFEGSLDCWEPGTGSGLVVTYYGLGTVQVHGGSRALQTDIDNGTGTLQSVLLRHTFSSPLDLSGMQLTAWVFVDAALVASDSSSRIQIFSMSGPDWGSTVWESVDYVVNQAPPVNVGAWVPVTLVLGTGAGADASQVLQIGMQLYGVPAGASGSLYLDDVQLTTVPVSSTPTMSLTSTFTVTPSSTMTLTPNVSLTATPTLFCPGSPVFGNTTNDSDFSISYRICASLYPLSVPGTITGLAVYLTQADGQVRAAIYEDPGGYPQGLMMWSPSQAAVVGWNILWLTTPIYLDPYTYWLAVQADGMNTYAGTVSSGNNGAWADSYYQISPPGEFPSGGNNTLGFQIYGIFCAAPTASATPTPIDTGTPTLILTPSYTPSPSDTPTVTDTGTNTYSPTVTNSYTSVPISSITITKTPTPTRTRTTTSTRTITNTRTITRTPTPTVLISCAVTQAFGQQTPATGRLFNVAGIWGATRFALADYAGAVRIRVYLENAAGNASVAIRRDVSSQPQAVLAAATPKAAANGWNTFDIPDTVLAAGNYWLALLLDDDATRAAYGPAGSSWVWIDPNPPSSGAATTGMLSIYADYCVLNTPTGTPTNTATFTPTLTRTPTATPDGGGAGRITFVSDRDGNYQIYVMDQDGTNQVNRSNNAFNDTLPCWSPNGQKIAFTSDRNGNDDICVMDADGTDQIRLTGSTGSDTHPSWSFDGSRIVFSSDRDGNYDLYVMDAEGGGLEQLTNLSGDSGAPHWPPMSANYNKIAFSSSYYYGNNRIWTMDNAWETIALVTSDTAMNFNPAWSPDGTKIAYVGWTMGYFEIFVKNVNTSFTQRLTNNNDDSVDDNFPAWSPDGTKIAFNTERDGNHEIYVMSSSGTSPTRLTNNSAADIEPDWY